MKARSSFPASICCILVILLVAPVSIVTADSTEAVPEKIAGEPALVAPVVPAVITAEAPTAVHTVPAALPGAVSGLVNNVFADEDIRQVLRDVAAQTGTTIIPDQSVQGVVSAELRNVPLEKALEMVLFSGGYVWKQVDGCYYVGSADPTNPAFSRLAETARVPLLNSQASELYQLLSRAYQTYVQADSANNALVVIAPQRLLEEITRAIQTIDQPAEQVMIEAMVVDINATAARQLGVKWRWDGFGFNVGDPQNLTADLGGKVTGAATGNTMSFIDADVTDLANLQLLLGRNQATIRANPRISTLNGREAEIFVGREQYFTVVTGSAFYATTQLQQVKAGISLRIRPYIGANGNLTIHIDPEVSDIIGMSDNGAPVVATRRVHSTIRCQEGRTIVLGGLTQLIKQIEKTKVPVLGDLPLIGNLFRSSRNVATETEIVVFLRPYILRGTDSETWKPVDTWPAAPTYTEREGLRQLEPAASAPTQ